MIASVEIATIQLSDYETSLNFSAGKLGFEKRAGDEFSGGMRWLETALAGRGD